jgi:adenosine kinase
MVNNWITSSLVTNLRCAEKFDQSHLSSAQVAPLIDGAKAFYVEGYFLTHGTASALEVSQKASTAGKVGFILFLSFGKMCINTLIQVFALNFSAPFIPQFFGAQLSQILPYTDIVIANEAEAESWANANGLSNPTDLPAVAKAIALQPKSNASRPRVVVITHGAESTVVVTGDKPDAKIYPVHALSDDQIVDTNGAGDAFAGGFMGAWVAGKNLDEAVEAGHKMGSMCVQQVRISYYFKLDYLLTRNNTCRLALSTNGPKSAFSNGYSTMHPFFCKLDKFQRSTCSDISSSYFQQ